MVKSGGGDKGLYIENMEQCADSRQDFPDWAVHVP